MQHAISSYPATLYHSQIRWRPIWEYGIDTRDQAHHVGRKARVQIFYQHIVYLQKGPVPLARISLYARSSKKLSSGFHNVFRPSNKNLEAFSAPVYLHMKIGATHGSMESN